MNIKRVKLFSNNSEKTQNIKELLLKENNIKIVDNNYDLGIAIDRVLRLFRKQYSLLLLILLV